MRKSIFGWIAWLLVVLAIAWILAAMHDITPTAKDACYEAPNKERAVVRGRD
ncbi:MAG: hypothetical protein ACLGPL_05410 [Acidobacteriota bacterium]